jgi:hypothetical protein
MISNSFFTATASTWFMLAVAGCVINLIFAIRAKIDDRQGWEFIAHLAAVIICAVLAIIIIIPYFFI